MILDTYSQIGQDIFVNNILKEKQNGLFLDIGCCRPIDINNTYLFEKKYNWDGISIDIEDHSEEWKKERKSKFICHDALTVNYDELLYEFLKKHNKTKIDYLSIDLEPPSITLEVLYKIPFDKYRFSVITFEHDSYRDNRVMSESREIFKKYNYKLIVNNVNRQEDWWIDNDLNFECGEIFKGFNYQ